MSELIQWKRVPVIGDKAFPTIEAAQEYKLVELLEAHSMPGDDKGKEGPRWWAQIIVNQSAKVIDILTTDENSRPSARKINGGRKPRKAQPQVDPNAELCKT